MFSFNYFLLFFLCLIPSFLTSHPSFPLHFSILVPLLSLSPCFSPSFLRSLSQLLLFILLSLSPPSIHSSILLLLPSLLPFLFSPSLLLSPRKHTSFNVVHLPFSLPSFSSAFHIFLPPFFIFLFPFSPVCSY